MKKWIIALFAASLAGSLLAGCGDEPRKEASLNDVCAAYKAQLDGVLTNTTMSEQDKINMIPRLSGYSACKDTVGTGGLINDGSAAGTAAGSANDADIRSRSAAGQ